MSQDHIFSPKPQASHAYHVDLVLVQGLGCQLGASHNMTNLNERACRKVVYGSRRIWRCRDNRLGLREAFYPQLCIEGLRFLALTVALYTWPG